MRQNKKIIIWGFAGVLAVLMVIVLGSQLPKSHRWDIDRADNSDHQPYDFDHFDEFLTRSLPQGYEVRTVPAVDRNIHYNPERSIYDMPYLALAEIADAPTDQSLLVINPYYWNADWDYDYDSDDVDDNDDDYDGVIEPISYISNRLSPTANLLNFARRGGQAVYVCWPYNDELPIYEIMEQHGYNAGIGNPLANDIFFDYTAESFKKKPSQVISLGWPGAPSIDADSKYMDFYYSWPLSKTDYYNYDRKTSSWRIKDFMIRPVLTYTQGGVEKSLGLEIYYPESGGKLYILNDRLHFCNLGLSVPGGVDVIERVISEIDHQPVVRIKYPVMLGASERSAQASPILSAITSVPALSWVWSCIFVLALLIIINGTIRRYPAVKGIEKEEIDKTNNAAVREYRFRKSPLLQFLYQCSWLYSGIKNYKSLFDINFRRMARTIARDTGIDINEGNDTEIRAAAKYWASMRNAHINTVVEEIVWMKDTHSKPEVSARDFSRSQKIVEKYPL